MGKLTDDDLDVINGKRQQLVGRIQERYGVAKDFAEKQADDFVNTLGSEDSADARDEERAQERARAQRAGRK